jgi:predicted kinase
MTEGPGLLAVFVGPSGSGKSTLAREVFGPANVVSSDALRELVAGDASDMTATSEAFDLLYRIVAARCRRHLVTAVDSTAVKPHHRSTLQSLADAHEVPCVAVAMSTPLRVCLARNAARDRQVPEDVITRQWEAYCRAQPELPFEGFAAVTGIDGTRSTDHQAAELAEFLARHGAPAVCSPQHCLNGVACYAPACYGTSDYARKD